MPLQTLKSIKTFYPPDPKSPNYEQEVTDALQKLSSEVNFLSSKVRELDEALTRHEAFYDAPIVADQFFLADSGTTSTPSALNNENLRLKFFRAGQPLPGYDTDQAIHGNGQPTNSFSDNFAGNNKYARTKYPHTVGMIMTDNELGNGGTTGTDFTFPVTGLYRVVLTCVFKYRQKSGQTADVFGCEPKVKMFFRGGSSLNSGILSSVEERNIQTVTQNFPQHTNATHNSPPYGYKYNINSAEIIVNVIRAADQDLGQNYNSDIRYRDTMFFRTDDFNTTTYDINLETAYTIAGSTIGKTNVIFQRIGPAILDKPT